VPSTPGVYTPGYGGGYNASNNNSTNTNSGNIPTIGIGKMSLGSRYNTPRRGVVGLSRGADDDNDDEGGAEGAEGMVVEPEPELERGGEADRERKVLMVDTTNGRGRGVGGMDVDG
jgi:hypothetical protein